MKKISVNGGFELEVESFAGKEAFKLFNQDNSRCCLYVRGAEVRKHYEHCPTKESIVESHLSCIMNNEIHMMK